MRDKWYGDNRDLVKWGALLALSRRYGMRQILQVLFYQPTEWEKIEIDGESERIPDEVIRHFRDVVSIGNLGGGVAIDVVCELFGDRHDYLHCVLEGIAARVAGTGIVFLDPDTGLEPESGRFDRSHVCAGEIREIWKVLRSNDLLVFYQHEDNKAGKEWKERKRRQFAATLAELGVAAETVKMACAPRIARDVAFYFVQKP